MPLANDSAAIDVIDHAPNGGKGHEMENCNGSGKKGKQKKTGKSIFYQANVHSNTSNISSSNSIVSNGYKSQKSDQLETQDSKSTCVSMHGNMSTGEFLKE